jgi:hypothetical protein
MDMIVRLLDLQIKMTSPVVYGGSSFLHWPTRFNPLPSSAPPDLGAGSVQAVGQRCGADTLPAISVFIGKSSETALSTLEIPATQLRGKFMCNVDPPVWGDRACDGLARAGTICATVACQLACDGSFSRKFSDRFGNLLLRQRP